MRTTNVRHCEIEQNMASVNKLAPPFLNTTRFRLSNFDLSWNEHNKKIFDKKLGEIRLGDRVGNAPSDCNTAKCKASNFPWALFHYPNPTSVTISSLVWKSHPLYFSFHPPTLPRRSIPQGERITKYVLCNALSVESVWFAIRGFLWHRGPLFPESMSSISGMLKVQRKE